MATVGYIGLGAMGARMCANLARKSGQRVLGFDIDPARAVALGDAGVEAAATVADLMAQADTVFLCVPGEPELRQLCFGPGGLIEMARPGQTIVDMTTAGPDVDREIAAALAERQARFADAPVARGVPSAEDGTLSITVGASDAVLADIQPLLECMGTDISHCGDIGTGQVVKLMNNMLVFQTVSALCEAMAIGTKAGVDREHLFGFLQKGSADSFVMRRHGSHMTTGEYPDDQFPTSYSLKDLKYALALAETTGVDARCAQLTVDRLQETIDRGWGHLYAPVMYRLFED